MNRQEKQKIADALTEIYQRKGDEILQDKKLVMACLKDEIPDLEKKTVSLLGFAVDCAAFSVIRNVVKNQVSKKILSVAKRMEDDYGANLQASLDIVDAIALFYGKSDGETEYGKLSQTEPILEMQNREVAVEKAEIPPETAPSVQPVAPKVYHAKKGFARGELSLPYCLVSTVFTLLIFVLDAMVYFQLSEPLSGNRTLTVLLSSFLAVLLLSRSITLLIKAADLPLQDGFTIWELCLWVASLIGGIALFLTLCMGGFSGSGWVYVLVFAELAMIVISGWIYFYKALDWNCVKGELSVAYVVVSSGITCGGIFLAVLAYLYLYTWYEVMPLWLTLLLRVFFAVLAVAILVRSIILLVKACEVPDSNKLTVCELFSWIGSMLGCGALLFLMMNLPYQNGWSYVIVVIELLMIIISGWRYFHEAFSWMSYEAAGVVAFLALLAFLVFLLINNIVATDYIPLEDRWSFSATAIGDGIKNLGLLLKSIGIFIAQVVLLVIGGGFWLSGFFDSLLLSGPILNTLLYLLFGVFFTMAVLEEK